jgi:hypothetical protein
MSTEDKLDQVTVEQKDFPSTYQQGCQLFVYSDNGVYKIKFKETVQPAILKNYFIMSENKESITLLKYFNTTCTIETIATSGGRVASSALTQQPSTAQYIQILGRRRKIFTKRGHQYVKFKGTIITLRAAKKMQLENVKGRHNITK